MNRIFLSLIIVLLAVPLARAGVPKPPVPAGPDGMDILPPPLDLDQMTPVALPGAPATGLTPQDAAILKELDEAQATPTQAPQKNSAPVATPTPLAAVLAATPTPERQKVEAAPAAPSLGAFADYFPAAPGMKWSYEYLKAAPGAAKKTLLVVCASRETSAKGTVLATFQKTQDGKQTEEIDSLGNDEISILSKDGSPLKNEFIYKFPHEKSVSRWTAGGNYFKAVFGKAQVYQKTYPDCVIVTKKTRTNVSLNYYAKDIGLVAVEVYGKGMKLEEAQSTALVSGPTEPPK